MSLIPRPRKNLVLYHGVLAAHCKWRERVVGFGRSAPSEAASARTQVPGDPATMRPRRAQWAELMRHAFGYALLTCPRCGGKMKLLACILDRTAIRKILSALGLPAEPLPLARASPRNCGAWDE